MVTILQVEGMSCQHCVRAVKESLESHPSVQKADVDLDLAKAQIEHEQNLNLAELAALVEEEGYTIRPA